VGERREITGGRKMTSKKKKHDDLFIGIFLILVGVMDISVYLVYPPFHNLTGLIFVFFGLFFILFGFSCILDYREAIKKEVE